MKGFRCLLLLLSFLAAPAWTADPLPGNSIYRLNIPLERQDGSAAALELDRGTPVLISMFYGSCPNACPLLINAMHRMEQQLPPESQRRLRVLLVSIDPENDTPEKLRELVARHRVDASRWTLARASADDVRKLAAVLSIRYRALPDGGFNHSTVISLIDEEGRIVRQTSEVKTLEASFVEELRKRTSAPVPAFNPDVRQPAVPPG